jgi:hypothetical protein
MSNIRLESTHILLKVELELGDGLPVCGELGQLAFLHLLEVLRHEEHLARLLVAPLLLLLAVEHLVHEVVQRLPVVANPRLDTQLLLDIPYVVYIVRNGRECGGRLRNAGTVHAQFVEPLDVILDLFIGKIMYFLVQLVHLEPEGPLDEPTPTSGLCMLLKVNPSVLTMRSSRMLNTSKAIMFEWISLFSDSMMK